MLIDLQYHWVLARNVENMFEASAMNRSEIGRHAQSAKRFALCRPTVASLRKATRQQGGPVAGDVR
jgi:hypothetical protein